MEERSGVHEQGNYERFCPRCGAPVGSDEAFCKKCGMQLPERVLNSAERLNVFCKFCGNNLHVDDEAAFCSGCGKRIVEEQKVSCEVTKKSPIAKSSWAFPITLLLFLVFSNITGESISWAFAGLGLVAVLLLWITKCIKPEKIDFSAICIPIAVLLLEGLRNLGFWVVQNFAEPFMGQYGVISSSFASTVFPSIENTYGANSLWLWGLLIWFLLLRSNTVRQKRSHYLIVGIGLIIWSLALTFIVTGRMLAMEQGLPAEAIQYIDTAYRHYFVWMFLRRFIVYCLFCYSGIKRLGSVGTLIFPAVIIVGSIILVPVYFAGLNLGMASISALSFGYLFGVIVLLVALIKEKKKRKMEDKGYVLPKMR